MKTTPNRWVVLLVFMLITLAVEIQWLTHAAVLRPAEVFYRGQYNPDSFLNLDFLAVSYMLLFLLVSFPSSYLINRYGIKKTLSLASAAVGFFGISKAIFAGSFSGILVSQIGLAIAQPFILNAVTALTVRWFPLSERGLAAGLPARSQYLGIVFARFLTPFFVG